jgi:hypothetical protein
MPNRPGKRVTVIVGLFSVKQPEDGTVTKAVSIFLRDVVQSQTLVPVRINYEEKSFVSLDESGPCTRRRARLKRCKNF